MPPPTTCATAWRGCAVACPTRSTPIVSKVEADAQPILYLAFSSDRHSSMEVTDFADRFVKDRLQNLSGVADVRIFGGGAVHAHLAGPGAACRLPPDAAGRRGRLAPAEHRGPGRAHREPGASSRWSPRPTCARRSSSSTSCCARRRYPVRLGDVGHAARARTGASRPSSTREAVALGVIKQATANPLDVSEAVRAELPAIQQDLPEGLHPISPTSSIFIREIDRCGVRDHRRGGRAGGAGDLLLPVLAAPTLIPLVTIPVSLVGAFALMPPSASRSTR